MNNPFHNDPHPDLTAAIRAVTEGKTLSKREMSALKRANAADLKEYPGKRGEAAHKRLHKVIKGVTEEKRRVTSIADLAPKHSPAAMDIIRANLGRGIRASATAAAEGKPMKASERSRRERVQAILARRTGLGSAQTAPRQKAAREAERAARAMGESVLDESPLSRLSDAQLDAKAGHHRLMGYRAEVQHQGSGVEWVPNKRSRGWRDVGKKGRGKFARVREPDPKLKLRAQRHHKAYDLAVAERERRREAEKKKSGK